MTYYSNKEMISCWFFAFLKQIINLLLIFLKIKHYKAYTILKIKKGDKNNEKDSISNNGSNNVLISCSSRNYKCWGKN